MKTIVSFAVLALLAFSGKSQTLSGTVKDPEGEVVPVAKISLENTYHQVLSELDGTYKITKIKPGTYTLLVESLGFEAYRKEITLTEADLTHDVTLTATIYVSPEIQVLGLAVKDYTPVAQQQIDKEEIEERNLGQDLPYLVQYTPSMVTTSDAGAGVGYTGMRIRGSDASRINVTVNGIPLNDAEAQGVFWVNMPDFVSTTDNIQIQRGVGSSTNGAGAFGATIDLRTINPRENAYGEIASSYGSFNTNKNSVMFGTGLLNGKWAIDGRVSQITSDGYIDRAESDLKSYFLSGGYFGEKTTVKLITFAGKERTYQSWWGTPEAKLTGDEEALTTHYYNNLGAIYNTSEDSINLFDSDRRYNYYLYENEVDNYQQDHYQAHLSHRFSDKVSLNAALHYTYGRGYFEQFRYQDDMADYGIAPIEFTDPGDTVFIENPFSPGDTLFYDVFGDTTMTIDQTDLIRRRWLDNHFYGATYSLNYNSAKTNVTFGGAVNQYVGDHFGEIIWAQYAHNTDYAERFYDNTATKNDMNVYLKGSYRLGNRWHVFGDIQARSVGYTATGPDIDQRVISVDTSFLFLNPKAGATFYLNDHNKFFASYAMANREPVRNDFIDAQNGNVPAHEVMHDIEFGHTYSSNKFTVGTNLYYMMYQDQLVLTGELNDVGTPIRTNVDESYRAGIELWFGYKLNKKLSIEGNFTYSQNKITSFDEVIYDYGTGDVITINHSSTDIAYSPSMIGAGRINYSPLKGLDIAFLTKYVGDQFLDNTSNSERMINAYLVNDFLVSYKIAPEWIGGIEFTLLVNNVFNQMYSSNGYTYSYIYGDMITENFYYPQAGTNLLAGLKLKF